MTSQVRRLLLITAVTFAIVGYVYLNLPLAQSPLIAGILSLGGLEGDLSWYVNRFASSFLLLGALPLGLFLVLGWRLSQARLGFRFGFLKDPWFWLISLVFLVVIGMSVLNPEVKAFYPFSKTLAGLARDSGWGYFLLHALAYLILYYLPWEVLFRGILIGAFLSEPGEDFTVGGDKDEGSRGDALVPWSEVFDGPLGLVGVQIFPTVLLHINHPVSEVLGAVVFGVLGGIWVLRYRSILPVLVLHWFAGLVSDGVIIFFG